MTIREPRTTLLLSAVAATAFLIGAPEALAQSQRKIKREADFLSSTKRGKEILGYLHFGSTYIDHEVIKVLRVTDTNDEVIPGHVALKVVFDWKTSLGENSTTAYVFFDEKGDPYDIKCGPDDTTSIISPPFVLANGAIQILGNLLIAAAGDSMNAKEKADMRKAVDAANARELLVAALKIQMRLGL
jgi:hypothetical protein